MRSEVAFVTAGFQCEWDNESAVIVYTSGKILKKNPVKQPENEAPCVCTVFGLSANRVRKSVTKERQDHECNSRALRATRQSARCWHTKASANSAVWNVAARRYWHCRPRETTSVSYFLSIFFVSAFLCFFPSCLHSCLFRLSIISSLLPHGFIHSSCIFQQVERKQIWK